ncbi:MAG: transporter related protein [Acidobacteria bacterium]|nr:transporter related protein [Acidobacteriota bacterium]
MKPIVRVEKLGKRYRLGKREAAYGTLRESIVDAMRAPFQRLRGGNGNSAAEILWALRDLNFEVEPGEVVGVIGRNGAGKSTLLKVLSRITEPTIGRAELYGRVASLLEVGTGFHPELTGRENIYLNGAILGMRKTEIARKFDEIVAFADLEKFLDTPVKRYSSGMYMRLAFAVASHLEPEILLVDEVLAVGDAAFQKKCLGKMGDVAKEGRTVIFVSHNMVAVQSLCRRVLWLERGEVLESGPAPTVVSNYLNKSFGGTTSSEEIWPVVADAPGNDSVRLHAIRVRADQGEASAPLTMKTPFSIEIEYWNLEPDTQLHVTLHLFTEHEIVAFTTGSGLEPIWSDRPLPAGLFRSVCHVPGDLLNVGRHRFKVLVVKNKSSVIYQYESAVSFEIVDLDERDHSWYGREPGVVQPVLQWTTEQVQPQ